MKVLITGAAGFVGSHLLVRLSEEYDLYAVARGASTFQHPSTQWIEQDLTLPLDTSKFPGQIDVVIHLAQSRHYREFPEQAADIFDVNVRSTVELLDYARTAGAVRFIYASSGGVYGHKDDDFVETDPVSPLNFYLTSKYAAELMIGTYRQFFHTLACRLFFVYGARQNPNMLVPRLVRSIYQGQPVTLQSTDGVRLNPIYVGDLVEAFSRALKVDGQHIVNVAGPQILSLREIAMLIGTCVGREPIFEIQPDQKPNHLTGDIAKMKALLGEPKTLFADRVCEVCEELLAPSKG